MCFYVFKVDKGLIKNGQRAGFGPRATCWEHLILIIYSSLNLPLKISAWVYMYAFNWKKPAYYLQRHNRNQLKHFILICYDISSTNLMINRHDITHVQIDAKMALWKQEFSAITRMVRMWRVLIISEDLFFVNVISHPVNDSTLHSRNSTLRDAHRCVCTVRGVWSAIVQK